MAYDESKGTQVVSHIIPTGDFPTHIANFGRGGYKTVSSIEERDAIPVNRLTTGSIVYVVNTDTEYRATVNDNLVSWQEVKNGVDEDTLTSVAKLDTDGKVLESQSRAIIFRGTYENETTFNSVSGDAHPRSENAIYIDNNSGKIYFWSETSGKFQRDSIYWNEIS